MKKSEILVVVKRRNKKSICILHLLISKLNILVTGPFTCWGVKNGFLVNTNNVVAKLVRRSGNLRPANIKDLIPPLRKSYWPPVESNP